jgi:hypothetical protein
MNLRLRPEAEVALRERAERTGRSQQEIVREAVDRYLAAADTEPPYVVRDREQLINSVLPPRTPYRRTTPTLTIPNGVTSLDLLDRTDRL